MSTPSTKSASESLSGPGKGNRKKPVPPKLTDEQRRQAYEKSLALRQRRAEIKAEIGMLGWFWLSASWLVPEIQGMKVRDLLLAIPKVGPRTADKLLEQAKIPAGRTVKGCGTKQAERLFDLLEKL